MTWWAYVRKHSGGAPNAHIASAVGVTPSSVGRWGRGSSPDPAQAAAFARAYDRPVLEAFIAAGFLTPDEAEQRPSAPPSLAELDDGDLLEEIRRRMQGGSSDAGNAEAEKNPGRATALGGAPDMLDVRDEAIRLATQGEGLSARKPTSITSLSPKHQQMVKDSMPVEEAAYTGHVRRGSDEWAKIKEAREAEKRVGEESQDDGGFDPA